MALTKVTSGTITDSAVTAAKIADGTVVAAEIADDAIVAAKIADDAVTTAKIPNSAITDAKISAVAATKLTGTVADARISALTASKLTGALPAISGASLTNLPAATSVAFPASQSASSNANTLDDYEEGSWTPAWIPTSGSWSGTFYARYIKIGRMVWASFSFYASAQASGSKMNGFNGLPFTAANVSVRPTPSIALAHVGLADHELRCVLAVNSTRVDMSMQPESTGGGGEFYPAHTASNSQFHMTITYEATA